MLEYHPKNRPVFIFPIFKHELRLLGFMLYN